MSQENNNENSPPFGFWGFIGYRFFDLIVNILSKAHWFFLGYFIPKYSYKTAQALSKGNGSNTININGDNLYTELSKAVEGYRINTMIVMVVIIALLLIIIFVQRNSLSFYKRKVGRLERGILEPLDKNRGSSNLTNTGSTNPGDRP